MASESKIDLIKTNNLEMCYTKFRNARSNWKEHWWDGVVTIYNNSADWATKYALDLVNRILIPLVQKLKKAVAKKGDGTSNVYLIKMFDNLGRYVYLKAGKANVVSTRLADLAKYHYKREDVQIGSVELICSWNLPNSHLAESFEQLLHSYLSERFRHVPNDRYVPPCDLYQEDFAEFDRRHQLIASCAA
jgi:hypothetical protein